MSDLPICDCSILFPGQGHHLECVVRKRITQLERQLAEAQKVMQTAADQIKRCDYTPARSTLLVAIAAFAEKQ